MKTLSLCLLAAALISGCDLEERLGRTPQTAPADDAGAGGGGSSERDAGSSTQPNGGGGGGGDSRVDGGVGDKACLGCLATGGAGACGMVDDGCGKMIDCGPCTIPVGGFCDGSRPCAA